MKRLVFGYLATGLIMLCISEVGISYQCAPTYVNDQRVLISGAAVTLFWPVAVTLNLFGAKDRIPFKCDIYK